METENFEANTAAFLAWLSEVGIQINPSMKICDLRRDGRGRGAVADADFEEDEVLFRIPRNAVLNIRTAPANVNGDSSQAILNMPSWLALTTLMISESLQTDSKWAPYFAVLPPNLDSLIFWSDAELAHLQASTVVNKIGKAKAEELFSQHVAPLGLQNCNTNMCHKFASIIMAYAFDIPEQKMNTVESNTVGEFEEELISDDEEDEETLLSMIPLADMLNADADRNNARLCCDNEDLEMRTIKRILKGEEIFNDYGQLPRSDLLRRYGYVTDRYATYDVAEIQIESILSTFRNGGIQIPNLEQISMQEFEKRVELTKREGVFEDSYDLAHPVPDEPSNPDELLAFLYLLLADAETLESISSSQSSLPGRSKLATELVGQVLAILIKTREREYATTVEEDQILLKAGSLPRRTEMAVQVRLGEKTVLREAFEEAASFEGSNKRMRLRKTSEHGSVIQSGKGKGKRTREEATNSKKKGRFQ